MAKRVLLGMSGGVDSSVSAVLLKEQGYEVIGVTMKLWEGEIEGSCCNLSSTMDAKSVCDFLSIPHYTLNFKDTFHKYIIQDFVQCYQAGKTPNPCIACNRYLKFGKMFQMAQELQCDFVATGHYAKTEFDQERNCFVLKKANALAKDQSYVLYNIPKEKLGQVIFPLGEFETKQKVREMAEKRGLSVAKKPDSEDICFVPDGDYVRFSEKEANIQPETGEIVNQKGEVLGEHQGLYRYTIGQRKGLGITSKVPLYVLRLEQEKNRLVVGEEKELYQKECVVLDVNWLLPKIERKPQEWMVKIRYSKQEKLAKVCPTQFGAIVQFQEPQKAITPGQSAVFYQGDVIVGGGIIQ